MTRAGKPWIDWLLPFAGAGVGLIAWWLATRGEGVLVASFTPAETFRALVSLISSGEIWPHLTASVRRVAQGLGIAAVLGIPLGILHGFVPRFERSTSILFQFVRMISPLAWMPIAVMLLGVGDAPVLFLITVGCVGRRSRR